LFSFSRFVIIHLNQTASNRAVSSQSIVHEKNKVVQSLNRAIAVLSRRADVMTTRRRRVKPPPTTDDVVDARTAAAHASTLATSLRIFATIPRAVAEAHIRLRGYDAPGEDASDARVRGALLKVLSDEVLIERECALKGVAYDPYVNARPRRRAAAAAAETRGGTSSSRSGSRETKILGGGGGGDESDSSVGVESKYAPRETNAESESEDEVEDAAALAGGGTYSDDEDEEDDDDDVDNFFGRDRPPAPEGANPFANVDFDPSVEARAQIEEAKRVVAERAARASDLSDAMANLSSTPPGRGVAFSDKGDDVASVAGSDFTDRFDAISLASLAATLGSDATDRVADVDGSEFDVVSLASHGTHRAITEISSDDDRAEVIYESGSDEPRSVSSDEHHHSKENAPPLSDL
jgi:hypothetical protein